MNILYVPMLISGILCTLLSIITWLFRHREKINRVFSFFTLTLAIDSFAFFAWFQYGHVEQIKSWMRFTFTAGFLVPIALVIFFYAFTGYDKKPNDTVLKIKTGLFKKIAIGFIILNMVLSQLTELVIKISDNPQHIWDVEFGQVGESLFTLFGFIFIYLFAMAVKSFKTAKEKSQKRFIILISAGTLVWLLFGYIGAAIFPAENVMWQGTNYLGTALMAVFFFVAILNHQIEKVYELNINLEHKVDDRTRELQQKNLELEDTLLKLNQMQKQVIVQEKMASLGQLVAGLTHELNTPISAIRSMNDTKAKAAAKLVNQLQSLVNIENNPEIGKMIQILLDADNLITQGTNRLSEIVNNLKNFVRLDESEMMKADIHEGLNSILLLTKHDMLNNINVIKTYGNIPEFYCNPRKLNQVFFNLIKNASQAIDGTGTITITTSLQNNNIHISIRDTGKGIEPEKIDSIFDPGFSTKDATVRASLGLSISSQIVQEHKGEIKVESQPGKGSVFTVILPIDLSNNN